MFTFFIFIPRVLGSVDSRNSSGSFKKIKKMDGFLDGSNSSGHVCIICHLTFTVGSWILGHGDLVMGLC